MARGRRDEGDRDLFRSGDFSEGDTFRKRIRAARQPAPPPAELADPGEGQGQDDCAQAEWCSAATRDPEGTWHPAKTFQAYCPACRSRIGGCLDALPFAAVKLLTQIGDRPVTGKVVRTPPGPRVPLRLDVDALIREMAVTLASWHVRVARVARLAAVVPDPDGHPAETIRDAVRTLGLNLDVLFALPAEVMARVVVNPGTLTRWAEDPTARPAAWYRGDPQADGFVAGSGEAHMRPQLGGVDAGREILDLHRRAVAVLRETRPRPDLFQGVPCHHCEAMSLERAEPPSDPKAPAKHSRCAQCGETMDKTTFDAWAAMYVRWSQSTPGLVCRRCERGDHGICQWAACPCRAAGHQPAAAA